MTLNDVLTEVCELKPNQYGDDVLIKCISTLEGKIVETVFKTHVWDNPVDFHGYTENDMAAELLVPEPYSELYKWYLFAMIDFYNGETDRYSASMQMFNTSYAEFTAWWNMTHKPLGEWLKL